MLQKMLEELLQAALEGARSGSVKVFLILHNLRWFLFFVLAFQTIWPESWISYLEPFDQRGPVEVRVTAIVLAVLLLMFIIFLPQEKRATSRRD